MSNNFKPRRSSEGGYRNNFNNSRGGSRGGGRGRSNSRGRKPERGIDHNHYTQAANLEAKGTSLSKMLFSDFNLNPKLQEVIASIGFDNPTEIQEKLIPPMLAGENVVAVSQTGSGKTGAFVIPLIDRCLNADIPDEDKSTLILVPTRELAYQVEKELNKFGARDFRLFSLVCIGGEDIRRQMRYSKKFNHFVVATPGRLIDLAKRDAIDLSQFKTLIVDEMDRMLDMGFIDDISWIKENMTGISQSGFFSATTNRKVDPIIERFAPGVPSITVNHPKPSEFVNQEMIEIRRGDDKFDKLLDVLTIDHPKVIIFVATKMETEKVHDFLKEQGYKTHFIHGDRSQGTRTRVIKNFRKDKESVLIATDVAARGLDIDDVTLVVNYDEPNSLEDYIHRIGRTGRAGKYGSAVTLVRK